jgi:FixJ family two-component response regulator
VLAIRHGAEDFLTKLAPREVVLAAVARAIDRDAAERAQRARIRALLDRFARLTPREHDVLAHVLAGAPNKLIASALQIDERSVKRHRTSFMGKLGLESVAKLVELARDAGYPSRKGL